jgi:hypothetical protein
VFLVYLLLLAMLAVYVRIGVAARRVRGPGPVSQPADASAVRLLRLRGVWAILSGAVGGAAALAEGGAFAMALIVWAVSGVAWGVFQLVILQRASNALSTEDKR